MNRYSRPMKTYWVGQDKLMLDCRRSMKKLLDKLCWSMLHTTNWLQLHNYKSGNCCLMILGFWEWDIDLELGFHWSSVCTFLSVKLCVLRSVFFHSDMFETILVVKFPSKKKSLVKHPLIEFVHLNAASECLNFCLTAEWNMANITWPTLHTDIRAQRLLVQHWSLFHCCGFLLCFDDSTIYIL